MRCGGHILVLETAFVLVRAVAPAHQNLVAAAHVALHIVQADIEIDQIVARRVGRVVDLIYVLDIRRFARIHREAHRERGHAVGLGAVDDTENQIVGRYLLSRHRCREIHIEYGALRLQQLHRLGALLFLVGIARILFQPYIRNLRTARRKVDRHDRIFDSHCFGFCLGGGEHGFAYGRDFGLTGTLLSCGALGGLLLLAARILSLRCRLCQTLGLSLGSLLLLLDLLLASPFVVFLGLLVIVKNESYEDRSHQYQTDDSLLIHLKLSL